MRPPKKIAKIISYLAHRLPHTQTTKNNVKIGMLTNANCLSYNA